FPFGGGFTGDGGGALNAKIFKPQAVAVDAAGNLFIADTGNFRVRRVTRDGVISTYAGNGTLGSQGDGGLATAAALNEPQGLAIDAAGNLFIADTGNHRIRRVAPDGTITTYAGNGQQDFGGDGGPATAASFNAPFGVTIDAMGNLYIADTGNHRIRRVAAGDGVITTVAGSGADGFSGDGGPAAAAQLNSPV